EVTDDVISLESAGNDWQTDAMELKIDGVPDDSVATGMSKAVIFTAIDSSETDPANAGICDNLDDVAEDAKMYARGDLDGGYILEYAIKIDSLGGSEAIVGVVDGVFGLGMHIIDNDGAGRDADEAWAARCTDLIWNVPSYLGTVKFLADNKVQFLAVNNMTGETNPLLYDGSPDTGVKDSPVAAPREFALSQNYPNPFNPTTTISYTLPVASDVQLAVYDILGREVMSLVNETMDAGVHQVTFDGMSVASGIYFYRLKAGDNIQTQKMMLLK
ncbi:T9SS type A sorting domain-containing protein, partial [candidate division KSB1 bacterium]|nr:T9SS type A sorting domain-containing protein [candidate division KSB1 bacterium]